MQKICFHITEELGAPALVISHDGMIVEILDLEDEIDLTEEESQRQLGQEIVRFLRPGLIPDE